ncbi:MAG TPA: response regulator [Opitutaceae bacterium]|nr:response regulator [Opitutaceae bacterium]
MPSPSASPLAATTSGRRLRVLYAEDVPELRELITLLLGTTGHSVDTAADGQAALRRIFTASQAYDVVITDHHMPGMNGLELVQQLRELAFPGKIVVFSSELNRDVHERYVRLRVDHILPKPVFPDTLRDLFAQL